MRCADMGASVTRVFRNFNVENRAHRLIGKDKPTAAPLHPSAKKAQEAVLAKYPDVKDHVHKKDNLLLSRLKEVYVDSSDPSNEVKDAIFNPAEHVEYRSPKLSVKSELSALINVENIPKGKISIPEALMALNNHKRSPEIWTAEKIASEYNLEIKDSQSLLEFFIPFEVKIIPPKDTREITER
ncbi:NADH dehydrogenase [ubiquinone] 1 alpha subcomplex assembly factor 4 [Spea bombifrons]|uniref:NADH dehydrogenase [ubiquinone] 1 alpha subcomplex assembly factor 4 n=1 Tax=Spea bombifrons TaxID=233779 RepID=UPI002349E41D|nr:NADH dehydrogenase [ubiquinone] 1 alpha subcomplex assembly factor 4 [Spea bombifrons]